MQPSTPCQLRKPRRAGSASKKKAQKKKERQKKAKLEAEKLREEQEQRRLEAIARKEEANRPWLTKREELPLHVRFRPAYMAMHKGREFKVGCPADSFASLHPSQSI